MAHQNAAKEDEEKTELSLKKYKVILEQRGNCLNYIIRGLKTLFYVWLMAKKPKICPILM